MIDARYPIGPFRSDPANPEEKRPGRIAAIAAVPDDLEASVRGLDDRQLDTTYRPDGWTLRQVVHHLPDSHMNAYVRFKLAVTEDHPTIKTYDEAAWAQLPDARFAPIEPSLALVRALHDRWVRLLRSMSDADFERPLTHPEFGLVRLDFMLDMYAWHGQHHVAHVTAMRAANGW